MEICFQNKKLEKLASDYSLCVRKMGTRQARILFKRLDDLYAVSNLEELRKASGHFHELIGDRKGQFACDLEQPNRLVFVSADPISMDKDGKYDWQSITAVNIVEIIDYHSK